MTIISSDLRNLDMQDWSYRGLAPAHLHAHASSPTEVDLTSDQDPYMFATPQWEYLNASISLTGVGFGAFDANGVPHSGTVTGAVISDPTGPTLTLSQLGLPVLQFLSDLGSGDPTLLRNTLAAGGDVIDGGAQSIQKVGGPIFPSGDGLLGGDGDDTINGHGGVNDTLAGGNGDDLIAPTDAQHVSSALVDGGAGVDTISYAQSPAGVVVDLAGGSGGQDTITNVERAIGSPFGDTLDGSAGADTIMAGAGNDTIDGGSGQSYLRGEDGDDSISGGPAFDDINGNMGNDTAHGNAGDDWVVGGKDNDQLFGDAGDDIVWGNLGNDTLDGGDGNDQVRGGQGDDVVNGGAGNDFVSGDRGNDTITGGAGADLFHGSQDAGLDKVLDFHVSEGDRVMLDPGTTYTVSQVGADTVIDMGGANQMILVGVQISSLPPGTIFLG